MFCPSADHAMFDTARSSCGIYTVGLRHRANLLRRIRRHHDQLVHAVGGVLIVVARQHGDAAAVGTPGGPAAFAVRRLRQLARLGAFARFDDPQILVRGAIGIRVTALAEERDLLAVGRPRRRSVVGVALGDHLRGLRREIEDADVAVEMLEIAGAILLEVIAIDHDRRRGLALPAVHLLRLVGGILILGGEQDARAVGRPLDVADAALEVADLLRFAAGAIQQPDLSALLLFLVGAARSDEREVLVVGTPARRRLAVRRRGELQLLAAVPLHHPDVGVAAILLRIDRRDRVGHPQAVRRSLRIADADDAGMIVERDGALRGLPLERHGADESRRGEANGEFAHNFLQERRNHLKNGCQYPTWYPRAPARA